jgi:hypothetical protein
MGRRERCNDATALRESAAQIIVIFMALNRLNASYIRVKSNILVNKFLTFNYSLFLLVTLKIVLLIDCCFFNVIVGLYTMLLRALGRLPKNLMLIKMVYFQFSKDIS